MPSRESDATPLGKVPRLIDPSRPEQGLFEQLFEACPDALVAVGPNGRMIEVNEQFERLFGYDRSEVVGQDVTLLVPERFRAAHGAHILRYFASPRLRPMGAGLELYAKRRDGTEFPVDIMLNALRLGPEPLVLAVVRDVTARKQAQEALRQSEERLRTLVASVKDYAILTLDARGHVTSWNSGAERIKGYRAEEIIGQHFSKFYTQEDLDRGKPDYELRVAAETGRFEDEGWRQRKDGSRFWANVIISPLRDSNGALVGFSKVTRDFTERKQAEEALLLEVTNTLVSNLDIRRLLAAVSAGIRQVTSYDYCGLALFDRSVGQLRLHTLEAPSGLKLPPDGTEISVAGSPAGQAFTSREPVVLNQVRQEEKRFAPADIKRLIDIGIKSACWVPLMNRGQPLGTLGVARLSEVAFTEKDVRLLSHLAGQIAIAIDNAETYRQVIEARERLEEEKAYLEEELRTEGNFEEIVGESKALKRVLKQVETVAPTDATVLILGETGTGKELIARAIHTLSGRRERTFVKLNCAAIPSGLLESELFGHEKGAFTGAISQKIGRLELAHRGTLFLDEVGDIPLELQPKLLRALQEKEFERLGSTRTIPVDVRLIAATNRDLTAMMKAREFRSDLYYRLRVFPIELPSLRMRAEDIPVLVHHFVARHARRMNKVIETIPPETMHALERWSWPGNVRELENLLERAVILSNGPVLRVPLSELALPRATDDATTVLSSLEATDRDHILKVLRDTRGVISGADGAAARLGLKRTTLNSKMRKLGISRRDI
ncbi:MAG TPA: sigma 54-interacting transcriptional regulator [Terriglobia bacterium]|nr:sigma 54-interacting transcriptional regulator [Terriglobia bacterium]